NRCRSRAQSIQTKVDSRLFYDVLFECVHSHGGVAAVPRVVVEDNSRLLLRAVALDHTDLTDFVIRNALRAARAVIEKADHLQVSERDSLRVLALLENPPAPNARLLAAARALPKRSKS